MVIKAGFSGLIQAVFEISISILGALIWACPNSIICKLKTTKKWKTCSNLLGHTIDINWNKKKFNKTKVQYCMHCLHYKTIIIYLKRTEVCLLVKSTLIITVRPCLRFITFSCFIVVLYPKVSFFIRQVYQLNLLKAGHLTCLLLSQAWYGWRKRQRFYKKKQNKKNTAT